MTTVTVTCNCKKCKGITAEVPTGVAAAGAHAAVVLATQPYGKAAGCKVVSR